MVNKKLFKLLSALIVTFSVLLTSCSSNSSQGTNSGNSSNNGGGGSSNTSHEHTFDDKWEYNDTYHWHSSTCGHDVKANEERHNFTSTITDPTYEEGGYTTYTCSTCGYSYVDNETDKLEHNYSSSWSYDENSHWYACTDIGYEDLKKDESSHNFTSTVTDPTYEEGGYTTYTCSVCGYSYTDNETDKLENNYSSTWSYDEDTHWHACIDEGYEHLRADEESHSYVTSVTDPSYESGGYTTYTCSVCGYSYTDNEVEPWPITITWTNYDGTVLEVDENVPYGSMPTYDGETPTKKGDSHYSFSFSGWSPQIVEAVQSATYIACFAQNDLLIFTLNDDEKSYSIVGNNINFDIDLVVVPSEFNGYPVTKIKSYAFSSCEFIKSIFIPITITEIENYAFRYYRDLIIYCEAPAIMEGWGNSWNTSYFRPFRDPCVVWSSLNGLHGEYGGFLYGVCGTYDEPYATIAGYSGEENKIVIPSSVLYEGTELEVKVIGENSFSRSNIISLNFEDGSKVETFGKASFAECDKLTSIFIPNSVMIIDDSAFSSCTKLTNIEIGANSNLIKLGQNSFSLCLSLLYFPLPNSINEIENYAFYACENLKTIYISSEIETIGTPFFQCRSLTIYTDAISCPVGWADYWNGETPIVWDSSDGEYRVYNGFVYGVCGSKDDKYITIADYIGSDEHIVVPSHIDGLPVKVLGESAFSYCETIKSINFSADSELREIEKHIYYFSGNLGETHPLEAFFIPKTVTTIDVDAFVYFSDNTILCYKGPYNRDLICTEIDGTLIINNWHGNRGLVWDSFDGTYGYFDGFSYVVCGSESDSYVAIAGYEGSEKNIYVPSFIEVDGSYLPVKVIAERAFYGNTTIETVSFYDDSQLHSISFEAFYGCSSLVFIDFPNSLTRISTYAFVDCINLTSIVIPKNIVEIDAFAFGALNNKLTIYCESFSKPSGWDEGWYINYASVVWGYIGVNGITDDGITYGVSQNEIGERYITITGYNGNDASINIPNVINVNGEDISVKVISENAFCKFCSPVGEAYYSYYSFLTSIEIPDTVIDIGDYAFYFCSSLASINIPHSVTTIGDLAFSHCVSLTSIYIPNSVTILGHNVFTYCDSLSIYCEVATKPSGWNIFWYGFSDCPVLWGCSYDDYLAAIA